MVQFSIQTAYIYNGLVSIDSSLFYSAQNICISFYCLDFDILRFSETYTF